ncbi:MAG: Ribosomal small subunit methyltransferase [Anaerolineales bacterium]|nr:Ribosomal small subunit methyltransferase [Anaerolineales bacterium]
MVAILSPRYVLTHAPVLLKEVVEYLAVQPGGRYVDCTTGAGGHARAVLEASSPGGLLLGLDADPVAIEIASENLDQFGDSLRLVQANFRDLKRICRRNSCVPVHGVLFDLGMSSMQLADDRGFSFQVDAPLDMRFGPDQALTADDIVNRYSEHDLADIIWRFGEESASRRVARAIVRNRPVASSADLAAIVSRALPGPRRHIHPATRTFQALRIAVNDELRIVKQFFQRESRDCVCPPEQPVCTCDHRATLQVITRRGVIASAEEVALNPRSRSAKLRAAAKLPEAI